jgi:hypothetical protein
VASRMRQQRRNHQGHVHHFAHQAHGSNSVEVACRREINGI